MRRARWWLLALSLFAATLSAHADEPHRRSVVARLLAAYPHAEHWFRIVSTLRFETGSDDRLVPVLSSLTHPRVRRADGAGLGVRARLPDTFRGPMRIESSGQSRVAVEVRPLGASHADAVVEDGLVTYADAYPQTDVLYKVTPTHVDEYLLLRGPRAPTRLRFSLERSASAAAVRQAGAGIEVVDAQGAAWLRATPPVATDASGRRVTGRLVVHGDELEVRIDTRGLAFPILVDPDWMATGDMSYGRFYHQATTLPDGRILATGGCSASICSGDLTLPACRDVITALEVLDMRTRTFSRVGDSSVARYFHAAERLPDGTVLLAGGCTSADCSGATASVEVVDLGGAGVRTVGALGEARGGLSSVALADGRVLLAGGCTSASCTGRTELYDPVGGAIVPAAAMHVPRGRAVAVRLADGRVLVAGGCTAIACPIVLDAAEVYDPALDTWTTVGSLATPRAGHAAARLPDGRVLVLGGCGSQSCTPVLASTELFDPAAGAFAAGPPLSEPRVGAGAIRLPDGSVLVSQGCSSHDVCDLTNEIYDPGPGTFRASEPAVTARAFHGLAYSPSAGVVVANGGCQPRTCSWWNETYDVSSLVPPPTDAGVVDGGLDAGALADAGHTDAGGGLPRYDAGRPRPRAGAPRVEGGGGCCSTMRTRGDGSALACLALGAVLVSRRRRRASA